MPVKRKSPSRNSASASSKAAARNTQTRPSRPGPAGGDALSELAADQETAAAAFEFNANKAAEHGRDHAVAPPEGQHKKPPSAKVSASTLTEMNDAGKAGSPASPGANPTVGPLESVRVDGAGQPLTTNQGVLIAGTDPHGGFHPPREDHAF